MLLCFLKRMASLTLKHQALLYTVGNRHLTMAEPSGTGSHFIQSGTTVATRLAQRLGPRDLMDVMGWRTFRWPCVMSTVMKTSDKGVSMLGTVPRRERSFRSDPVKHRGVQER